MFKQHLENMWRKEGRKLEKMTKSRLEGYKKLKWDIVFLQQELSEMTEGDKGMGNSTIMDYRKGYPRPQNVMGFDWKRYEQKQRLLEKKITEAAEVKLWIENIEDGQTRYVFRMWYLDNLSWKIIAKNIGIPHNEDYPRKCIRDTYLKKVGII